MKKEILNMDKCNVWPFINQKEMKEGIKLIGSQIGGSSLFPNRRDQLFKSLFPSAM
jgi:hypothetical protein